MNQEHLLNVLSHLAQEVRKEVPTIYITMPLLFALQDAEHMVGVMNDPQPYDESLDDLSTIPFGRQA